MSGKYFCYVWVGSTFRELRHWAMEDPIGLRLCLCPGGDHEEGMLVLTVICCYHAMYMENTQKIALVTGATSGIGQITALELARAGITVVCTTRSPEKGERVGEFLIAESGNANIHILECELESQASIRSFCERFGTEFDHLDILVNNAGTWESKHALTMDEIERTFAVNHLAPFLLTNLLLPFLANAPQARVVNVSSELHRRGQIDFDDLGRQAKFGRGGSAYNQSKLANVLFTRHLARQLAATSITVNCLHPGLVSTGLFKQMNPLLRAAFGFAMITPQKGAQTSIYLATSSEVQHVTGQYFKDQKLDAPTLPEDCDAIAARLWETSAKLTHLEQPDLAPA